MRNSVTAPLVIVVSSSAGLAQARSQDLSGIWAFGGLQTANASLDLQGLAPGSVGETGSNRSPAKDQAASGLIFLARASSAMGAVNRNNPFLNSALTLSLSILFGR